MKWVTARLSGHIYDNTSKESGMKNKDISEDPDMIELERMIDAGELDGDRVRGYANKREKTGKTKVKRRSGKSLELSEDSAKGERVV